MLENRSYENFMVLRAMHLLYHFNILFSLPSASIHSHIPPCLNAYEAYVGWHMGVTGSIQEHMKAYGMVKKKCIGLV